jgi:hypothetical protein
LRLRPRDLAKVTQFIADDGRWSGRQVTTALAPPKERKRYRTLSAIGAVTDAIAVRLARNKKSNRCEKVAAGMLFHLVCRSQRKCTEGKQVLIAHIYTNAARHGVAARKYDADNGG